jgi:hypothetical protein
MQKADIKVLFYSLYYKMVDTFNENDIEWDVIYENLDRDFVIDKQNELLPDLSNFYVELNGFEITWNKQGFWHGRVRICGVRSLFDEDTVIPVDDYRGFVINNDYSFADRNNIEGFFRIIDRYDEVLQVGFFSDPKLEFKLFFRQGIYYWDLKLTFMSYLRMGFATNFFYDWPSVIVAREYQRTDSSEFNESWQEFHEYMPQMFPDFRIDDFFALYDSLKLRN